MAFCWRSASGLFGLITYIVMSALITGTIVCQVQAQSVCSVELKNINSTMLKQQLGRTYNLTEPQIIIMGHFRQRKEVNYAVGVNAPKGSALLILKCNGDRLSHLQTINFFKKKFVLEKHPGASDIDQIAVIFTLDSDDSGWVEWNKKKNIFEFDYLGVSSRVRRPLLVFRKALGERGFQNCH